MSTVSAYARLKQAGNSLEDDLRNYPEIFKVWVLKITTPHEKQRQRASCRKFRNTCNDSRQYNFNRIVTPDESWIHYYELKFKQVSMQ